MVQTNYYEPTTISSLKSSINLLCVKYTLVLNIRVQKPWTLCKLCPGILILQKNCVSAFPTKPCEGHKQARLVTIILPTAVVSYNSVGVKDSMFPDSSTYIFFTACHRGVNNGSIKSNCTDAAYWVRFYLIFIDIDIHRFVYNTNVFFNS